jgi:hypothetical protein
MKAFWQAQLLQFMICVLQAGVLDCKAPLVICGLMHQSCNTDTLVGGDTAHCMTSAKTHPEKSFS